MIYLVSYTLNPPRDVTPVVQAIQAVPGEWWHFLDDTWLISTREDAAQIYQRIFRAFYNTDRFLIVRIDPNATASTGYNGWLPRDAWDWIEQRRRL